MSRTEVAMDWIERWFGISPDGGDGSLEIGVAVVLVAMGAVLVAAAFPGLRGALRRRRQGIAYRSSRTL